MTGRRVAEVLITAEGRDKGRVFVITEMSATQAEKLGTKALLALAHSGVEIPPNVQNTGWAGLAVLGLKALMGLQFEELEPLMDEMFSCIQVKTDSGIIRNLFEEDIQEVTTRLKLRSEVFEMHTGFSLADANSKSTSETQSATSRTTKTSRGQ